MTNYNFDRNFTNFVHRNIAIPKFYSPLKLVEKEIDYKTKEDIDINKSIDYIMINQKSLKEFTIQERFRDSFYKNYNDITFRFERKHSNFNDRKKSELYKIKAKYFLYGITNGSKFRYENECNDFLKFCFFKVHPILNKIESGDIIIDRNLKSNYCRVKENKMIVPVNINRDKSSEFTPFDVKMFNDLFPGEIILKQKGFF